VTRAETGGTNDITSRFAFAGSIRAILFSSVVTVFVSAVLERDIDPRSFSSITNNPREVQDEQVSVFKVKIECFSVLSHDCFPSS